jgi:hypothetical protein
MREGTLFALNPFLWIGEQSGIGGSFWNVTAECRWLKVALLFISVYIVMILSRTSNL